VVVIRRNLVRLPGHPAGKKLLKAPFLGNGMTFRRAVAVLLNVRVFESRRAGQNRSLVGVRHALMSCWASSGKVDTYVTNSLK